MKIERIDGQIRLTMNDFEAKVYAEALLKVSETYLDEYMTTPISDAYEYLNRNHGYCKNAAHFIGNFLASDAKFDEERGQDPDDCE